MCETIAVSQHKIETAVPDNLVEKYGLSGGAVMACDGGYKSEIGAVLVLSLQHELLSQCESTGDVLVCGLPLGIIVSEENGIDLSKIVNAGLDTPYGCDPRDWSIQVSQLAQDVFCFLDAQLEIIIPEDIRPPWSKKTKLASERSHLSKAQRGPGRYAQKNRQQAELRKDRTHNCMGYALQS